MRMSMEIIFVIAAATGRTLVLPPKEPLYRLRADTENIYRNELIETKWKYIVARQLEVNCLVWLVTQAAEQFRKPNKQKCPGRSPNKLKNQSGHSRRTVITVPDTNWQKAVNSLKL